MNGIKNLTLRLAIAILWLCVLSCQVEKSTDVSTNAITVSVPNNNWNDYWYDGKAEVNSYKLTQSRYGQDREGTSILIFVTEDFSKEKQVKMDNPDRNPSDKVSVLKTNMVRKFNTGIYDYSMMASVFTPVSLDKYPNTLKVTASSQEWCGHTWSQYNRENRGYNIDGKSYFESEGDKAIFLKSEWLEDELWNRIRINPDNIPTGKIKIIPGSFYSRLNHVEFGVEEAVIEQQKTDGGTTFSVRYTSIDRELKISMEQEPPFKITSWEESTSRGKTKATLMKSMHIPYWSMNGNQYETYRDSLMLN